MWCGQEKIISEKNWDPSRTGWPSWLLLPRTLVMKILCGSQSFTAEPSVRIPDTEVRGPEGRSREGAAAVGPDPASHRWGQSADPSQCIWASKWLDSFLAFSSPKKSSLWPVLARNLQERQFGEMYVSLVKLSLAKPPPQHLMFHSINIEQSASTDWLARDMNNSCFEHSGSRQNC